METNLRTDKLLDQIGWKLLNELQINGRLSYAELGRRVGLTTPAVVERVKRMEEAGIIIGYHADVDPMKVGMPITAFIRVQVSPVAIRSPRPTRLTSPMNRWSFCSTQCGISACLKITTSSRYATSTG